MNVLVCVDVQNDFIDGNLGVDKNHVISDKISEYAKAKKDDGYLIFATQDTHYPDSYGSTLEGKKLPIEHCILNTDGWKIYEKLSNLDEIFEKNTFMCKKLGKFLDELSNQYIIDKIEICGFCTSICVISNALFLRGLLPNTKISVLENLCGDINEFSHRSAIDVLENCQIDIECV